jgi:hypothetical protein
MNAAAIAWRRGLMVFVRRKRVGPYEYYQLVESYLVDGKPRQRVLLHLGRYPTVDAALEGWPKETEGLRRFARQQRDTAERLTNDSSSKTAADAALKRAQKAEALADDIAAKLEKLDDLRDQGKV